jgi:flavin reductase (DIM6/NTAB) family NADH-FMN oxidoreductase RutF
MARHPKSDIARAMAQMPGGLFVLTSSWEGHAGAVLVKWVQPCSDNPPMVMVAINKGQHIEPLLRNSRSFVLCQISDDDRFLLRKFGQVANGSASATASSNGVSSLPRDDDDDEDDDDHDEQHDRAVLRGGPDKPDDDPLVTMTTSLAPSGAPIVDRAMTYLDCEIVRHIELESDYRIYVGQVHAGALLHQGTPAVQFGGNGSTPAR